MSTPWSKSEAVTHPLGSLLITNGAVLARPVNQTFGYNTASGVKNPNFRTLIAHYQDASSAYDRMSHSLSLPALRSASSWGSKNASHCTTYFDNNMLPFSTVVPSNSNTIAADDIALKRLKGKLARDLDEFKALMPLGEIKETRNLIRSTADVTTNLLKHLIQLKHGRTKGLASAVSKAWLQYSFAVSPTISDTNQLLSSISSYMTRNDFTARYAGSADTSWSSQIRPGNVATGAQGLQWQIGPWQANHTYKVQYVAGTRILARTANNYGIPEKFGLTFEDIIPALWELTVFSWVADYFGTMGDFLEDTFSSNATSTIYCTKSIHYEIAATSSVKDLISTTPSIYKIDVESGVGSQALYKRSQFKRTGLSQLPSRALRFKTVDEIGANSIKRVLNLGSVLLSKGK